MLVNFNGQPQAFSLLPNVGEGGLFSNIESAHKRGLKAIGIEQPKSSPAVIVGGGPSLVSTLENIRHMKECGATVFALNNSAKFLVEHGIRPDYQVVIDGRPENADFFKERWAGEALVSAQCHPSVFDTCLEVGYPLRLWYPAIEGISKVLGSDNPTCVWSGWTVGLTAMALAEVMGHRELHLFGYDSCHSEHGKSHAYDQPINESDEMMTVTVEDRTFNCSVTMASQAAHFEEVCDMLTNDGCTIHVHGEGLIPHIARKMSENPKVLTAVYDLGSSPPTFDFISFLCEAEKARVEGGFELLDVVFQPGPMKGFRNDNLPPSIPERQAMLHRVCVSACRLLPSVRNVAVLKRRMGLQGDIFPKNWSANNHQAAHYGAQYFLNAARPLRATESSRNAIRERFPMKYATITLRECDYWPERNSNRQTWDRAARELQFMGIRPIIVPDFSGHGIHGFESFDQASVDIDLRLALYEKAEINLGVMNGPMALCFLGDCRYIVWKPIVGSYTADMYTRFGITPGQQYGDNGWVIWEEDTTESVLKGIADWFKEKKVVNA